MDHQEAAQTHTERGKCENFSKYYFYEIMLSKQQDITVFHLVVASIKFS